MQKFHTVAALRRRAFLTMLSCGAAMPLLGGCAQGLEPLGVTSLISPQEEAQLGVDAWNQIKQKERVSNNQAMRRRVTQIGSRIVQASGAPAHNWEFEVFENEQVNAFAVPGGKIGVYTGFFKVADTDAQVAAVLGHEVGHVVARHAARRMSTQMVAQMGMQLAQAGLGSTGYAPQLAQLAGVGIAYGVILPYSRTHEYEADALGVQYMAQAGYDPREAIRFWEKMAQQGSQQPAWADFASTHPADGRRIQALEALMPEAMRIYNTRA